MELAALVNIVSSLLGKDTPYYFTLLISIILIIFLIWFYVKKLNITTITSIGTSQNDQLKTLNELVISLSEQLKVSRDEINNISRQNSEFRNRIIDLEIELKHINNLYETAKKNLEDIEKINKFLENTVKENSYELGTLRDSLNVLLIQIRLLEMIYKENKVDLPEEYTARYSPSIEKE